MLCVLKGRVVWSHCVFVLFLDICMSKSSYRTSSLPIPGSF